MTLEKSFCGISQKIFLFTIPGRQETLRLLASLVCIKKVIYDSSDDKNWGCCVILQQPHLVYVFRETFAFLDI
ncbi:hypothetical protein H6B51_16255 [Pseudoflavonifractor phocaeensis]|nr:hypothetical protein [Pseudoflavonifractor phocaeensis]